MPVVNSRTWGRGIVAVLLSTWLGGCGSSTSTTERTAVSTPEIASVHVPSDIPVWILRSAYFPLCGSMTRAYAPSLFVMTELAGMATAFCTEAPKMAIVALMPVRIRGSELFR